MRKTVVLQFLLERNKNRCPAASVACRCWGESGSSLLRWAALTVGACLEKMLGSGWQNWCLNPPGCDSPQVQKPSWNHTGEEECVCSPWIPVWVGREVSPSDCKRPTPAAVSPVCAGSLWHCLGVESPVFTRSVWQCKCWGLFLCQVDLCESH